MTNKGYVIVRCDYEQEYYCEVISILKDVDKPSIEKYHDFIHQDFMIYFCFYGANTNNLKITIIDPSLYQVVDSDGEFVGSYRIYEAPII